MEEGFRIALGLKGGNAVPTNGKSMRKGSPCGRPDFGCVLIWIVGHPANPGHTENQGTHKDCPYLFEIKASIDR